MNLKPFYPYLVGVGAAGMVLYGLLKYQKSGGNSFFQFSAPNGLYGFAAETGLPLSQSGYVQDMGNFKLEW